MYKYISSIVILIVLLLSTGFISDNRIILDRREKKSIDFRKVTSDRKEDYLYEDISSVLKEMEDIDFQDLSNKYRNKNVITHGISLYFDSKGNIIRDLRKKLKYTEYIIVVNKSQYITTVYGYDKIDNELYYTPIVSFPCAINQNNTKVGKFLTTSFYDWHMMANGKWAQYAVRFDGKHLFHSALYNRKEKNSIDVDSYNGINRKWSTGGCVRLRAGDAYYLYKIMTYHTLIVVHESDLCIPFERETFPELEWVPYYASESELYKNRYDPTDPYITNE